MTDLGTSLDQLVIIDMQEIFRAPSSQWAVSGYAAAAKNVSALAERFAGRVIWTRFVRDPDEHGSWRAYYDRWSECRAPVDSPEWDLTIPASASDAIISLPTFSKWGDQLAALTADADRMVVCGVATDCCVLSTVLGAVDAGRAVTVVTDACAGITEQAHDQAIALMDLLSPMVTISDTAALLADPASH